MTGNTNESHAPQLTSNSNPRIWNGFTDGDYSGYSKDNLQAWEHMAKEWDTFQSHEGLFITDTHLQPELDAAHGCDMAFRKARSLGAEFAVQGGDHVFDALGVPKTRALSLFDLYDKTQQDLGLKVYHTLGNHDCFGVYPASGVALADPQYGKRYYEDHVGKTFYSFAHCVTSSLYSEC